MSRGRKVSESGLYHVIQKGAGNQVIFESDADRKVYLRMVEEFLAKHGCTLYAWCLMSNHVHLLLRADPDQLSCFMHDVGVKYASRFNYIQGHSGPVFKGRYYSEPIESERHLLEAVRYIHNNPVKARICAVHEYRWSSYREYTNGQLIVDTTFILGIVGGIESFRRFSREEDRFLSTIDRESTAPMGDEKALEIAKEVLAPLSPDMLKQVDPRRRRELVLLLRDAGIRASQVSRITGLGTSTIGRIYKDD